MIAASGGHFDYSGNEVDALVLDADVPQWQQICAPTTNDKIINGNTLSTAIETPIYYGCQFYLDLKPSPTHTYYAQQYINSLDRLLLLPSAGYPGVAGAVTPVDWPYICTVGNTKYTPAFNYVTKNWEAPNYVAEFVDAGDWIACLAVKNPLTDDIYYSRNVFSPMWKWTAATNTWTILQAASPRYAWYCPGAIDPYRGHLFVTGGSTAENGWSPLLFDLNCNQLAITLGGLGAEPLSTSGYPAMIYADAIDAFLFLRLNATGDGSELYQIDAGSWEVTRPATTGPAPIARVNGFSNSLQYVPELRSVVIADSYDGNVKFMRVAP